MLNELSPALVMPLLLMAVGFLVLLPTPVMAAHRNAAAITGVGILLSVALLGLVMLEGTAADLLIAMPVSMLMVAPLLERARFIGLLAGSLAGTFALLYGMRTYLEPALPEIAPLTALPLVIAAGLLMGQVMGVELSLHPRRWQAGEAVWHPTPQAPALAGWMVLTLALAAGAMMIAPGSLGMAQLAGSLVAALVALLHAQSGHGEDALQKAGEGLAAGLMITLLAPLSPMAGAALGLVAGFFVSRSEAMSLSLRLEDPHHFLGSLMLPSLLGVVLAGLQNSALLAASLQWLGAVLALATAIAILLWPLVMLAFGVALPARLVREGVRTR